MSVPNTDTFSMQDVVTEIGGGDDLIELFDLGQYGTFDPLYVGDKTNLLNFRNYTYGAPPPPLPSFPSPTDNAWKFDETTGITFANSNGGTQFVHVGFGDPHAPVGKDNYALNNPAYLQGSGAYINAPGLNFSSSWNSWSFWMQKKAGWDAATGYIWTCARGGINSYYGGVSIQNSINHSTYGTNLAIVLGDDAGIGSGNRLSNYFPHPFTTMADEEWVHVVLIVTTPGSDDGDVDIYYNTVEQVPLGVSGGMVTMSYPSTDIDPRFFCGVGGSVSDSPYQPLLAPFVIDEFYNWKHVITTGDIAELYNGGAGSFWRPWP